MDSVQSAEIATKLGQTWWRSGHPARAEANYRNALNAAPAYVKAHLYLVQLLLACKRNSEAREQLSQLIAIRPDDAVFAEVLEMIVKRRQTVDSAPRCLELDALPPACDLMLFSDSGGVTSGVAQANTELLGGLIAAGHSVVCVQPHASACLHPAAPHVFVTEQYVYDPKQIDSVRNATDEPEQLFAAIRPKLIIFADGSPMSNIAAKRVATRLGIPFAQIVHCVNPEWADTYATLLDEIATYFGKAHRVWTVSHQTRRELEAGFRLPEGVGTVIYNGRPPAFFAPRNEERRQQYRRQLKISRDKIMCLTVARWELDKGYQHILASMHKLREDGVLDRFVFVWVGMGTAGLPLRILVEEGDLVEHVRFLGRRDDVPSLLDASDIFLLPSRFEGMPLALLEAMAKGLPAIATAVSGTPEALSDCGFLLPNPAVDEHALVAQLSATLSLWAEDENSRQRAGACAARRARALFTQKEMVEAYRDQIESLLQEVEDHV